MFCVSGNLYLLTMSSESPYLCPVCQQNSILYINVLCINISMFMYLYTVYQQTCMYVCMSRVSAKIYLCIYDLCISKSMSMYLCPVYYSIDVYHVYQNMYVSMPCVLANLYMCIYVLCISKSLSMYLCPVYQ